MLVLSLLGVCAPISSVVAGTIVSPHQYAWSNSVGYLNFEYVTVSDAVLGGYIWSANAGWIKLAPAQGGVVNDGAGHLSGSAWGEHLGWISFDGVDIGANGVFTGTADGPIVGVINFDCPTYCDVRTDWRPAALSTTVVSASVSAGGGGGGGTTENDGSEQEVALVPDAQPDDVVADDPLDVLVFNELMVHWESTEKGIRADLNHDGTVDVFDFNVLMVYWGTAYPS